MLVGLFSIVYACVCMMDYRWTAWPTILSFSHSERSEINTRLIRIKQSLVNISLVIRFFELKAAANMTQNVGWIMKASYCGGPFVRFFVCHLRGCILPDRGAAFLMSYSF